MDLFEKCWTYAKPKQAQALGIYPYFVPFTSQAAPQVTIGGRTVLMFGSINYLGLTEDARLKGAAIDAIQKYGTGCTGSRLLNGTLDLHEELEHRIARFMGKESALVFTTGFQTNLGIISALVGREDVVVLDRACHASIVDGSRLAFGKMVKFAHNDMEDLERILAEHAGRHGILVVVDGVFSMEGDLANLPEIVRLKQQYGARLMVDDAHGIGVMGPSGRGTAEHFGVADAVDLVVGTFSKSFASTGGFVAGNEQVIYYIKHTARAFLFSASTPPASAASALAALDIMETEPERFARLWENTTKWKTHLDRMGFNTGHSATPIVPIVVGNDFRLAVFWRKLFDAGVFANAAVAPAVEPGHALLRTSCMATHEDGHLDQGLEILQQVGRQLSFIE
ncbi:MAG: pyridoxal phosphate-dependent aminotransferase family protein [Chloroflexi bacterium]|nr:pyridoxal phosphate-dependent aminotransferase family protein [Chloroflexota bacterium]